MRKTIIALFALAAVGLVQPTVASARGGGGGGGHGGGGGGHGGGFGGGGGFHGGGGGGWHGGGGGGWHGGGMAWHGGGMRVAAIGAGVPRPIHPKSQTQRRATANPSTDGTAATHRHRAAPAISTLKPSHPGSSQNHRPKNAAPTASETTAVSQR